MPTGIPFGWCERERRLTSRFIKRVTWKWWINTEINTTPNMLFIQRWCQSLKRLCDAIKPPKKFIELRFTAECLSLDSKNRVTFFALSLSLTPLNRRAELKLSNYQHPDWRETILLALHSIICGLTFVHFSCVLCFITIPHSIANLRAKAICHRLDVCVCVWFAYGNFLFISMPSNSSQLLQYIEISA